MPTTWPLLSLPPRLENLTAMETPSGAQIGVCACVFVCVCACVCTRVFVGARVCNCEIE